MIRRRIEGQTSEGKATNDWSVAVGVDVGVTFLRRLVVALALLFVPRLGLAIDPPHGTNDCLSCHIPHNAPGGSLTRAAGDANLCLSCHQPGGLANSKAFVAADQAVPWPGLPTGQGGSGTSHRWDSGAAGHVTVLSVSSNSSGTLLTGGAFTGLYAKTYSVTISSAGNAGVALFNWGSTYPGGAGTNVLTGTNVALNEGVMLTFVNGTGTSFQVNDQWTLQVRTDLRAPVSSNVLTKLDNGLVTCSACHNQHSQLNPPFDTNAPAYSGSFTGAGRHYMRVSNEVEQLCVDCHAARVVTNAVEGSHPVGMAVVTSLYYRTTTRLPLEGGSRKVRCLTCHTVHYAPSSNGNLLRLTNSVTLCVDCHTLADTSTPGAHFVGTNSATLWPGGQYGSTFPQRTNTYDRGTCVNCHAPHGWPDAAAPTGHYPVLLVDREENLCFTCHDADGPAVKRVYTNFTQQVHHPVSNTDPYRRPGRSVECSDCHHVHDALANGHVYSNAATSTRNLVSNPLKGVSGVAFSTNGLANFQVVDASRFSVLSETNGGAVYEYQVCFKCHTGYGYPNFTGGTASFVNNSATVTGTGTSWTTNMVGMWLANTNDTRTYVITAVASATSLTLSPAYAGTTASGQGYYICNIPATITPFYTTGSALFSPGSAIVTGSNTSWNSNMVGSWIYAGANPAAVYKVVAVNNATNLTISPAYQP